MGKRFLGCLRPNLQDVNDSGTTITRTDASALPETSKLDDELNVSNVGGKS